MKHATPFSIIAETVCAARHLTLQDIQSPKRNRRFVNARFEVCWLVRHYTDLSTPEIGKALGGRDHTSVLNAFERQEQRVANEPFYSTAFDKLRTTVETALRNASLQAELNFRGDDGLEIARKLLTPGNFRSGLRPGEIRALASAVVDREQRLNAFRDFAGKLQSDLKQIPREDLS